MKKIPVPLLRKTIKAMENVIEKWYADAYNSQTDIDRLIIYEQKLKKILAENADE